MQANEIRSAEERERSGRASAVLAVCLSVLAACGSDDAPAAIEDAGAAPVSDGSPMIRTDAGRDGGASSPSEIPTPTAAGPAAPATCEWLAGPNCWTRFVEKVRACAPSTVGRFSASRESCEFDSGARLSLSSPPENSDGEFLEGLLLGWREQLRAPDGTLCFRAEAIGIGDGAFFTDGDAVVYDSTSYTSARIICADGSSFEWGVEGACSALASPVGFPTHRLTCDADARRCESSLAGATTSPVGVWSCGDTP